MPCIVDKNKAYVWVPFPDSQLNLSYKLSKEKRSAVGIIVDLKIVRLVFAQLIFDRLTQPGKKSLSNEGCWNNWVFIWGRNEP